MAKKQAELGLTATCNANAGRSEMSFWIDGNPVTWKRTVPIPNAAGKVRMVKLEAQEQAGYRIAFAALNRRPRGWPRSARYAMLVRVNLENHQSEGDCDNYGKLAMDALQKILWDNDRQVDCLVAFKTFGDGPPRTEVETVALEETAFGPLLAKLRAVLAVNAAKSCPVCGGTGALVDEYGTRVGCCEG